MNDNTMLRYARLYQAYCGVVAYYGELARSLSSDFLVMKAAEQCCYKLDSAKKILNRIKKNATLRRDLNNILRYEGNLLMQDNGNQQNL